MPAQPLLGAASLVDEVVAVVDQQLDLPVDAARPAAAGSDPVRAARPGRSRARRSGPTCRASCPRAAPGTVSFGGTRTSVFATPEQLPFEPARELPAVLDRPQPLAAERATPSRAARRCRPDHAARRAVRPASSTATAVTDCLCTSSPITIIYIASKPLGATGERTDLNRGRRPRSYQVTLDGLGRRRRHNAGRSAHGRHSESSQPPPTRVCASSPDATTAPRMTLSSGMSPELREFRQPTSSMISTSSSRR